MSADPYDKRLRSSAFLESGDGTKILIDIGPDFRYQALKNGIEWIDGVLITHSHQDHIGGLDELRQYNFLMKRKINIFGNRLSLKEIRRRFGYIFEKTQEGGGKPKINLVEVKNDFLIGEMKITPIPVIHGAIAILGYRIGGLAYITDASYISAKSIEKIYGVKHLVINALRLEPHPTHFNLEDAVRLSDMIKPEKTYLIHLTHKFMHGRDKALLPPGINFAYDGLCIYFD
jgi:phosphoribosyl 1,2-cyclic phosphate phosphodiesterase